MSWVSRIPSVIEWWTCSTTALPSPYGTIRTRQGGWARANVSDRSPPTRACRPAVVHDGPSQVT